MKTVATPLSPIEQIDGLAKLYAAARAIVAKRVTALEFELRRARNTYLAGIKTACATAATAQAGLQAALEQHPDLFEKPRTMTLHGIKVGYQKGKGKIVWDDEDKVAERILAMVPALDDERFLSTTVKVKKDELLELDVATLKKLGCRIEGTGDFVLIKASDSEIDKFVARLLEEGAKAAEEAA